MLAHAVLEPLVDALSSIDAVRAAAVVGSHSTGHAQPDSDVDVFAYIDRPHHQILDRRRRLADALADRSSPIIVSDLVYPHTDVWTLRTGSMLLDLMFWQTTWAEDELERRSANLEPSAGYSTAFWRSFVDGVPIYDRDGWLADFSTRARTSYPEGLAQNIVDANRSFLGPEHPFSLWNQIAGAIRKQDAVAVQHRSAAWVASYFDVVFAMNRILHPGEKRQITFAEAECRLIPEGMTDDIHTLVSGSLANEHLLEHLSEMILRLDAAVGVSGFGSTQPIEE